MKCLWCQHENRPQAKLCEECASPFKGVSPAEGSSAGLKGEVERARGASRLVRRGERVTSQAFSDLTLTTDELLG